MAYRREDIERVRDATDLVELVGELTKVRRSGRSVMAVCPFHQEKTPSMSVDPARGLYHCFGCGKGGDVYQFVQETQGLDFADSVELLARRAGIALQQDPQAARRRDRRQALIAATEIAVDFYTERLKQASDAATARSYLRGRGYDGDVVDRFHIGYSPTSGDALVGKLRRAKVPEDVAITAGLALRANSGRVFDRFRGRVMFPIYDVRGDAVGFGARLLEGEGPKYLNSPETPIYHKSRLLYGLNWAKSDIVREQTAVVVEGYTDVIALHLADRPLAVATCGTALGDEHLDLLRRFTERVVLMFDADTAGAAASVRGFESSIDIDLRVAELPEGSDPADIVASGDVATLTKAIDESVRLLEFLIDHEMRRFSLEEPEARDRAIATLAPFIAALPAGVTREEYTDKLARKLVVDQQWVERAVRAVAGNRPIPEVQASTAPDTLTGAQKAERGLLRLLLDNDPAARTYDLTGLLTRVDHEAAYDAIQKLLADLEPGTSPDLGKFLSGDESNLNRFLRELALSDRIAPADELFERLEAGQLDRRIDELERRVESLSPDAEEYSAAYEQLITLQRERRERQEF